MKTITIKVENLKCNGCTSTIKKGIIKFHEVRSVEINIEDSSISICFEGDESNVGKYKAKLTKMGYPVQGNNSTISIAKSFISCAIGRVSK